MPAIPSWLLEPLWDQFAALLPGRPVYDPAHPLGCHKPRIADRIIFEKLIQVLRFGCSYASIADCTCEATTIRERRDEWIKAGIFGLNAAALYGIEPVADRCEPSLTDIEKIRASLPTARTYGPETVAEAARMIAAHQAGYVL